MSNDKRCYQVEVDGFPPKKDGAASMWNKPGEIPRLQALRQAMHEALRGATPPERDISVTLTVFVGPENTRMTGDLDSFIAGVCDGLMVRHRHGVASGMGLHDSRDEPDHAAIHPDHWCALADDSQVVEITARKVISDRLYYRLVIEGEGP